MSESKCFIHFSTVSEIDEILIATTKASLCKIIECRKGWSVLDGEAKSINEQSFTFLKRRNTANKPVLPSQMLSEFYK